MKWIKETAFEEINKLLTEIDNLSKVKAFSADHIRWQQRVITFFEEVFGKDSSYYRSFILLTWHREGHFLVGGISDPEGSFNPQVAIEREHHKAYLNQLDSSKGLLLAAQDELGRKNIEDVYVGKDTGPEASLIVKIINLAEHKLRKIIRKLPENEKIIQDAVESLLIGADVPYSRETDSIEYSSKTYVPDFSVQRADLAVEIKICNRDGREKEIIAEINDDILAYKTKYGNIIFVVYDIGKIRDIDRFGKNFEEQEGVIIKIVKH